MSHGAGDPRRVIRAALTANFAIALTKFVATYVSGSAAMLAEAIHSVADTGNQGLLLVGLVLSTRRDDARYALGRAKERYFWPFIVALLLFSVGGLFAVYEGIHKLSSPEAPDMAHFWSLTQGPLLSLIVLAVSVVLEGMSCSVAWKEFKRTAGDRPLREALLGGKDPTIPLVLLEDFAALVGLAVALTAIGLSAVLGSGIPDAVGSVVIGVLLCVIAVVIARDTHGLLIGERASPEVERAIRIATESTPGVVRVTQLLTYHLGPDFALVALKVAFTETLTVPELERVIDDAEARIRAAAPEFKKVFVEPDSDGDLRGLELDGDGSA